MWDGSPETRCDACKKSDKPCSEPEAAPRTRETSKLPETYAGPRPSSSPAASRAVGRSDFDYNTSEASAQPATRGNIMSPGLGEPLNIAHRNSKLTDPSSQQFPLGSGYLPSTFSRGPNDNWAPIHKNGDTFNYGMGPYTGYDQAVLGPRYHYQQLVGNERFRLIRLLPGEADNDITINLTHVKDDPPEYQALSCTWGNDPRQHPIIVKDDKNKASVLNIQPNVHAALKALCSRSISMYLWIDAICINQDDVKERSGQILMMETIYREATNLLIVSVSYPSSCSTILFTLETIPLYDF